jgi:hypothetical protein
VSGAPVFAQYPEHFAGAWYYRPEAFERVLKTTDGGWLPEEWEWYRSAGIGQRGECCGILGGNRVDFINHYARIGIRLIEDPANQPAWAALTDKEAHNILFEQYLLSACLEYHKAAAQSPYRDVSITYVFEQPRDAFNPAKAAEVGYTHLMGAKRDGELARRLEMRVMKDYPQYYERCLRYAAQIDSLSGKPNSAEPFSRW